MDNKIHTFEQAGLGKAPFNIVNIYEHHEHGIGDELGVTDYGTNCDFCMTYIRLVFVIQSSDGKTFKVGSTCVNKTGDKGLIKVVKAKMSERRRAKLQAEREEIQRKNAEMWAEERRKETEERTNRLNLIKAEYEKLKPVLAEKPHPNNFLATRKHLTLLDYLNYFLMPDTIYAKWENWKVLSIMREAGANV